MKTDSGFYSQNGQKLIKMLHLDIGRIMDSGDQPPSVVSDCVSRVLQAEYHVAKSKDRLG